MCDYSKFCTTDDVNYQSLTTEIYLNASLQTLNQILKKVLDFEAERVDLISYDDIPYIIERFKGMPDYASKNAIYFTLGYLALRHEWDVIWRVQELFSTWLDVPLASPHTIRYYRYLKLAPSAASL
jgi:hypothetical protein